MARFGFQIFGNRNGTGTPHAKWTFNLGINLSRWLMDEMPRAAVDPLVMGRVIGDVLDMFVPSAELAVSYGANQIGNGFEIQPWLASESPIVHIRGSPNYYTLASHRHSRRIK